MTKRLDQEPQRMDRLSLFIDFSYLLKAARKSGFAFEGDHRDLGVLIPRLTAEYQLTWCYLYTSKPPDAASGRQEDSSLFWPEPKLAAYRSKYQRWQTELSRTTALIKDLLPRWWEERLEVDLVCPHCGDRQVHQKTVRIEEYEQKGIDVALAVDMVSDAFRNAYDCAMLIAGDQDFIEVVRRVQSLNKRVVHVSFRHGRADALMKQADRHISLDSVFGDLNWKRPAARPASQTKASPPNSSALSAVSPTEAATTDDDIRHLVGVLRKQHDATGFGVLSATLVAEGLGVDVRSPEWLSWRIILEGCVGFGMIRKDTRTMPDGRLRVHYGLVAENPRVRQCLAPVENMTQEDLPTA